MAAASSNPRPQAIDLGSLPIQQLNQVKTQLTQELQHLASSFQQLKTAQARFKDCIKSVKESLGQEKGSGTPILVPLTPSLYVPGKLASTETVLVDIGTGFYVEKTPDAAQHFYGAKVEELGRNLGDLERILQGKETNLGTVEEALRQKVLQDQSRSTPENG